MSRFRDDKMNLTRRGVDAGAGRRIRLALPFLMFVSVGLLVLSRLNHTAIVDVRGRISAVLSPALEAASAPLSPLRNVGRQVATQVRLAEDLQHLKTENQKLSSWEWRARELERKLADLERLARVMPEARIDFVTSRVIADSSGAFVRSVLIDAGRARNVKSGYPVINADGLVGRVIEAGEGSARVLLATDLNCRIPVVVGASGARAILAGDSGPSPRLIFLAQDAKIAIGDDVATSGAGGLFPRGLRIGKVTGDPAHPHVDLRANLDQLEYVSVLFYDEAGVGTPGSKRAGLLDRRRDQPGADSPNATIVGGAP
ncbi:MAG: rod shape-determining protein MreC [Hyphomicrobium sp.]